MKRLSFSVRFCGVLLSSCLAAGAYAESPKGDNDKQASQKTSETSDTKTNTKTKAKPKPGLDHSGQPRKGKASFYADRFAGRKMADGTPMNPNSNVAASRTLPLGTKAEVTNLDNGKKEVVEIRDRGPYVDGRIVDLSPKVAKKLDMDEKGIAPVVVTPIEVPQPDGSVKPGAAASGDEKIANR
jgi:rare lipoprotein A